MTHFSTTPPLLPGENASSGRASSTTRTKPDTLESRVLRLLRDGMTLPEIADTVGYSIPGINKVIKRIKRMYGARTTVQAVAIWLEEGRRC